MSSGINVGMRIAEGRYSATSDGRIWSHITNRFLKQSIRRDGYLYIIIRVDGKSKNMAVHRMVATAWHGIPKEGMQVNHKNLNKTDNHKDNLEWCTGLENTKHAWDNLPDETIKWMRERRSFGAKKMNRKKRTLSSKQITDIRKLVSSGISRAKVAERFQRSRSTIDNIINWKIYRD